MVLDPFIYVKTVDEAPALALGVTRARNFTKLSVTNFGKLSIAAEVLSDIDRGYEAYFGD